MNLMSKLFKKIVAEERKSIRVECRLTVADAATISASAEMRNISVSDFMRRAALGRRADVHFETEIVISLREVAQSIQAMHAAYVRQGAPPPDTIIGELLDLARDAMLQLKNL